MTFANRDEARDIDQTRVSSRMQESNAEDVEGKLPWWGRLLSVPLCGR
jgi:hypothetical protein